LLHGGAAVKALSVAFLSDFERHWRKHGGKVLDILAEKYAQAYFAGAVALSKMIRWETADIGASAACRLMKSWIGWRSALVRKGADFLKTF
jgi:hypothetical protein